MNTPLFLVPIVAVASTAGCALPLKLPNRPPPLLDMQEPLALTEEPADEAARSDLANGGFTGIYVGDARRSLDALTGESEGVLVIKVIENSPGDAAGIVEGDLLLWGSRRGDPGGPSPLNWPSDWRQVELSAEPGTRLDVGYDRAGVERIARVEVVARIHPAARQDVERYREEDRVGVVLRTATEVEARAAGLGPGAGAVIVGLSRRSPWRAKGLRFGDLIVAVDGKPVAHPQVLLDAIRGSEDDLRLTYVRQGARGEVSAPSSERETELKEVSIPLLLSYQSERGVSELTILLGLFGLKETPAAWRCRLFWLFTFSGGDADRLKEVDS